MHIVDTAISIEELKKMSAKMFARLIKAVVDIEKEIMINLYPSWGNKSRGVDDPKIRECIIKVVTKLVKP